MATSPGLPQRLKLENLPRIVSRRGVQAGAADEAATKNLPDSKLCQGRVQLEDSANSTDLNETNLILR